MSGGEARYTVSVRSLCEFAAKSGDLDLRYTPTPTAQEGLAGHRLVADRRRADDPGYRTEVPVAGHHGVVAVRGRADGFDAREPRVDEVKTHKGDLARVPGSQRAWHRAQAGVYGALLCAQEGLEAIDVAVVYLDLLRGTETPVVERRTAAALRADFESLCDRFAAWADAELAHRRDRDAWLSTLAFPRPAFRAGQRPLAEATYRTVASDGHLLAEAPTGSGKTLGTLFPALKAMPVRRLDKLAFLTAKRSGRAGAVGALRDLVEGPEGGTAAATPRPLRVLELVAREQACEHPDRSCRGVSCPLARGFYDRLPAARAAAVALGRMAVEPVRALGLAHGVCPYWLRQELLRWADVAVGDFAHWFDVHAGWHAMARLEAWAVSLLVDEAHNLVERGRSMYSASLDGAAYDAALRAAPEPLRPALRRVGRGWQATVADQEAAYRARDAVPEALVAALREAAAAVGEWLVEAELPADHPVLRFHFAVLRFDALASDLGSHSVFETTRAEAAGETRTALAIRNIVPAPHLRRRFEAARSSVLFSATLTPNRYYLDLLGMPGGTRRLDVASPFDPAQLAVRIVDRIPTRLDDRPRSLAPIARLIAAQLRRSPGRYLAFFSSFDYLEAAESAFRREAPELDAWVQPRAMTERDRATFLARFEAERDDGDGGGVGFAVLGGAFAEGIDLPGDRLIGAFVVTLGMPPFGPENERVRETLDAAFGDGHAYAYLYPGLRKVVQAAGRVIRTPDDRGHLVLIDPRYRRREVRALLPAWWRLPDAPGGGEPTSDGPGAIDGRRADRSDGSCGESVDRSRIADRPPETFP